MIYGANDEKLTADRYRCKDLCHELNLLRPSDTDGQRRIIKNLLGKTGEIFAILSPFWRDFGYGACFAAETPMSEKEPDPYRPVPVFGFCKT